MPGPAVVNRSTLLRRVLVAGTVALVFVLGVSAASPALHHWLHEAHGDVTGHEPPATMTCVAGCAVLLFASGTEPLGETVMAAPQRSVSAARVRSFAERRLSRRRDRSHRERGPPQG